MVHLGWLPMWFENIFKLKINLEKSELVPIGMIANVNKLAPGLGYRVRDLLSACLGLPLGAPFKSMSVKDGVEESSIKSYQYGKGNIPIIS